MSTVPREPDRLVLFTDAVVAIACTLLILPLVDVVSETANEHGRSLDAITEHQPQIWSFLLSFVVIGRLWLTHHRIFQHVQAYNRALMLWNFAWLLTIVVLPFPTEMIGAYGTDHFTATFYLATVLAGSCCQTVLTLIVRRTPEIAVPSDRITGRYVVSSVAATGLLAVALLVTLAFPGASYYSLLLLLLSPPLELVWQRLRSAGR